MNILVCFNNNDYLTTKINCSLEEAKTYYIGNDFGGKKAMFVLDIDKPFKMKVTGLNDEFMTYTFNKIDYHNNGFDILLYNHTWEQGTSVEPQWFYIYDKRIIIQ